jgi:hypothetical protein
MSTQFPPYGLMPTNFINLKDPQKAPGTWKGTDYAKWLQAVSQLIGNHLWPLYVAGQWAGDAVQTMEALTHADFDLFPNLRARLDGTIGLGMLDPHEEYFRLEDEGDAKAPNGDILLDRSIDRTLRAYLTTMKPNVLHDQLANDYLDKMAKHCGLIPLHLKSLIQRPRALQMAVIMGKTDFTYRLAGSAASPAMISGHCYQGMIGGIAAYYSATCSNAPQATLDAIAKHMVDVGDRRVFAGVHYPSDNLSSWITLFLAYPFIFPNDAGRIWAWEVIQSRSAVFHAMRDTGPASPFAAPLAWLKKLAEGKRSDIVRQLYPDDLAP